MSIMATIRWCPIYPKWDIYQPLLNHQKASKKHGLIFMAGNQSINDSMIRSRSSKLCTTGMLLILDGSWTRCSSRVAKGIWRFRGWTGSGLKNPWLVFMIWYDIILYDIHAKRSSVPHCVVPHHDMVLNASSCHYFRMLPNFQGYLYSTKSRVNKHVPFHFNAHITVHRYVQYPTLFLSSSLFFYTSSVYVDTDKQ